jgi:DNA-binding NtrC family response regulator
MMQFLPTRRAATASTRPKSAVFIVFFPRNAQVDTIAVGFLHIVSSRLDMGVTTTSIPSRDSLLLDRFAWTTSDGWIDLSTDRRVFPVEHGDERVSAAAWMSRCARLEALWCSHLIPLLDHAVVAGRRIEVHDYAPDAMAPAAVPRTDVIDAVAACLQQRGLNAGIDDGQWIDREALHVRLMASRARAIAIDHAPRAALGAVESVLEAGMRGPMSVRITAVPGAGLSTFLGSVARVARRHGVVPVCPQALARPEVLSLVRGRTVVLLVDEPTGQRMPIVITLAKAVRQSIGVAAVVGQQVGGRDDLTIELAGLSFDVLTRSVSVFPPLEASTLASLVQASEGVPGRLVRALRQTVDVRRRAALDGCNYRAEDADFRLPASRVAEPRDGWPSTIGHPGWRALEAARVAEARGAFEATLAAADMDPSAQVESLWGLGVCALESARLEESEQWLRSTYCALADCGPSHARIGHGVLLSLTRCLLWQGRTDEAAAILARASRLAGENVWALRLSARIAFARRDGRAALATLARAGRVCTMPAEQAAVHADYARWLSCDGDHLSSAAHLSAAVRGARAARGRALLLRLRALTLETHARAVGRRSDGAVLAPWRVQRAARVLLKGSVPLLIRLRASRALEALGWRRTREIAAFVERWSEAQLWPSQASRQDEGDIVMVSDLQAVLEICRDVDDPIAALERVCHCLRQRLHASGVAVHVGPAEGRRLTLAGSPRLSTGPLAMRVIESGVAAPVAAGDGGAEAGAPVAYGGHTIGAIVVRWALAPPVESRLADALLAAAATAVAPHVQAVLDRARAQDGEAEGELGFLGASPAITALRDKVRRAALAPFHVLIEGESGSGKEMVAKAIHAVGPRRRRRFCALNCAALTDDLIEAELFGHARGAFTGAVGDRTGLFEDADGGTLFLDEVGELSTRAQAKLLRVIQEGEVRRVGENTSRRIDARLVAATNRSLRDEATAGRFRPDLLYRLDVVRINVPPLRERPEDIVLLARLFWRDATTRMGSRATLHPGTVAALARYHWPGNVRELQNVVSALAVNAPLRGPVMAGRLPGAIAMQPDAGALLTLDAARRSFEERFVRTALARAGNQTGRAARDLGLTRQGLRKLLVRLRIEMVGDTCMIGTETDIEDASLPAVGRSRRV